MKIDNVDKVREAKKQKEGIQVICYVSEAALAVATSVFEWTVPAASLFGVPMKFISDWCNKDTLEGEYVDAVDRALKSTKETFRNYHSKLQIIDGLSVRVGELDEGLADAIKKTEEYQLTYSTEIDARDIIVEFERHFHNERHLREFCVSVFRQNQEYHVINVHDGAYSPWLQLSRQGGAVCAPCTA